MVLTGTDWMQQMWNAEAGKVKAWRLRSCRNTTYPELTPLGPTKGPAGGSQWPKKGVNDAHV